MENSTQRSDYFFEPKADSKTRRGDFGVKTFFTTFNFDKKDNTSWIEAVCVNHNQKITIEYNDKLPEIKNHQLAVRKLIEKHKIKIKKCQGFPVVGKDSDFVVYANSPEIASTKIYSFKI